MTYDSQAKLFKALSHPARLAILDALRDGEQCVCHLEAALGYRQAYISQQLMILREAGVVQDRRDGWNMYYQVTQPSVFTLLDAVTDKKASDSARGQRVANCPCPHCNPQAEPA